jgi:hypothetical protein
MTDTDTPKQPPKPDPVKDPAQPAPGQEKSKRKDNRTNRGNYYKEWYLAHKKHKHELYIKRKQNSLKKQPDGNKN